MHFKNLLLTSSPRKLGQALQDFKLRIIMIVLIYRNSTTILNQSEKNVLKKNYHKGTKAFL